MSDLTVRELRDFLFNLLKSPASSPVRNSLEFVLGFVDGVIQHEEKYKQAVRGVEN